MAITRQQRENLFGPHCDTRKHVSYKTPWDITVKIHIAILEPFVAACDEAAHKSGWKPTRIDHYNCRSIRGSDAWSLHSFGLGWDFFLDPDPSDTLPPPGGVWKPDNTFSSDFAEPFLKRGFKWGRYFTRQDWPHIEWPGDLPTSEQKRPYIPPRPQPTEEDWFAMADEETLKRALREVLPYWQDGHAVIIEAGDDRFYPFTIVSGQQVHIRSDTPGVIESAWLDGQGNHTEFGQHTTGRAPVKGIAQEGDGIEGFVLRRLSGGSPLVVQIFTQQQRL